MKVVVYTKHGKLLHEFRNVGEISEYNKCFLIVFENDDRPRAEVYGKKNVIIIKS